MGENSKLKIETAHSIILPFTTTSFRCDTTAFCRPLCTAALSCLNAAVNGQRCSPPRSSRAPNARPALWFRLRGSTNPRWSTPQCSRHDIGPRRAPPCIRARARSPQRLSSQLFHRRRDAGHAHFSSPSRSIHAERADRLIAPQFEIASCKSTRDRPARSTTPIDRPSPSPHIARRRQRRSPGDGCALQSGRNRPAKAFKARNFRAIELVRPLRYTGSRPLAGEMGRSGAIRPVIAKMSAAARTA
jgi:hypothetical protein